MNIEVRQRENPIVTGIVSNIIQSADLPLYEQAAQNTGFGLSVSAKGGQPFTFWYSGDEKEGIKAGMRTVIVPEDRLGITIIRPAEQKDHSAFWREYRELKHNNFSKSNPL